MNTLRDWVPGGDGAIKLAVDVHAPKQSPTSAVRFCFMVQDLVQGLGCGVLGLVFGI